MGSSRAPTGAAGSEPYLLPSTKSRQQKAHHQERRTAPLCCNQVPNPHRLRAQIVSWRGETRGARLDRLWTKLCRCQTCGASTELPAMKHCVTKGCYTAQPCSTIIFDVQLPHDESAIRIQVSRTFLNSFSLAICQQTRATPQPDVHWAPSFMQNPRGHLAPPCSSTGQLHEMPKAW